jgi:hypothetical protein
MLDTTPTTSQQVRLLMAAAVLCGLPGCYGLLTCAATVSDTPQASDRQVACLLGLVCSGRPLNPVCGAVYPGHRVYSRSREECECRRTGSSRRLRTIRGTA